MFQYAIADEDNWTTPLVFSGQAEAADGSTYEFRATVNSIGQMSAVCGSMTPEGGFCVRSPEAFYAKDNRGESARAFASTVDMAYHEHITDYTIAHPYAGATYTWTNSGNELTANCLITQSGTVTFTLDGVTYSAAYSMEGRNTLGLAYKTNTYSDVGNDLDTAQTATAFGNVPAVSERMRFLGSDASVLFGLVSLPLGTLKGDVSYSAFAAFFSLHRSIGTVKNDGTNNSQYGLLGTVTLTEERAVDSIDPGLIALYE
jgi:hypothetical protein